MRQYRNAALIAAAIAAAAFAVMFLGCATVPVVARDCHIADVTIYFTDEDMIGMLGMMAGYKRQVRALAQQRTGTIWVQWDDPEALGHEIEHFCTVSPEEDDAIDERDTGVRSRDWR